MITSPTNRHLTEIRKLASASWRSRSGRFVAEGEDLNEAAFAAGVHPCYVLAAAPAEHVAVERGWLEVEPALLLGVSALASGTRAIGVYEQRWSPPAGPLAVALWGVRDPGNVGTAIRSAGAFGAACAALGPGCADPYGPKAMRASMGAIFGVRIARFTEVGELPGCVIGLDARGERSLRGPRSEELTLLVGAEREGLPPEVLARCDEVARIPQVAGDSLNAATAAAIALYEVTRMAAG